MLRCYGAFNLAPSPSSNKVLWPSCNLDVLAYMAVLAVHLGDAELLANKDETEATLRHWTSVKILLVILLQDRSQSPTSKCYYKSAGCSIATSLPISSFGLKNDPSIKRLLQ